VALDRALDDDRNYTLAHTLRWAVNLGAPSSTGRLGLTPEQVAAEYAKRVTIEERT
jgi:hypothetical protein